MDKTPSCRVHLRHKTEERWAQLTLSLKDDGDEGRFLDYSGHLVCQIDGLDALSSSYTLENWESAVMSGAFFAFRRLKKPLRRLLVSEIAGSLRAEDMDALALAATMSVTGLLGGQTTDSPMPEWESQIQALPSNSEEPPPSHRKGLIAPESSEAGGAEVALK